MFLPYNQEPTKYIQAGNKTIAVFKFGDNIDKETIQSFGEEWQKFNNFSNQEITQVGNEYFDLLANIHLSNYNVLDIGCGSGRWTKYLAPLVKTIEAIDPSAAVFAASKLLQNETNVRITCADVSNIPFNEASFDLVFSLGVLHHIPDTRKALNKAVKMVKPGGYFLVYLYYNLDNRGFLYKCLFKLSNFIRKRVSMLPAELKKTVCDIFALTIYMPFVLLARAIRFIGLKKLATKLPLAYYADKSFFIIRNDALDRFGTPLEQRFSKAQIEDMMKDAGLTDIVFSNNPPYWHAIGKKA
jgi:ubiquinone/menaquinone biosynthesis C-methylase UbiE